MTELVAGRDRVGFAPRVLAIPAMIGLALLILPLTALVLRVEWSTLWQDITSPEALSALGLSLTTGLAATVVCVVLGVPLALVIARSRARTAAVLRDVDPPAPQPPVLATAALSAYGQTPRDAAGDARVLGDNQLHLHVANLPKVAGYYEVWLIDPGTMKMFSVGTLSTGSGDQLLPIPANVDLRTYSVVDVSAEQYDNKPAHSGDSLLRGTLTS